MSNYKVSIVVPTYNQEKYLDQSLPSLLNQDYQNIEIVIVNDGSTDSTCEIIEKYANRDRRIKIVDKVNEGLVSAVVSGIENVTGDFVVFVDPDDRIGERYISTFLDNMEIDLDFLSMGFYYDKCDELKAYYLEKDDYFDSNTLKALQKNFFYDGDLLISNRIFISRWNKMYKSDLLKSFSKDLKQYTEVSLGEDTIFTFLMLMNAQKGKAISKPNSYFYNIGNQNSMMKRDYYKDYLKKLEIAHSSFSNLLSTYDISTIQADALFYILLIPLYERLYLNNRNQFYELIQELQKWITYQKVRKNLLRTTHGIKNKGKLLLRENRLFILTKDIKRNVTPVLSALKFIVKNFKKYRINDILYQAKFYKSRLTARTDLYDNLPVLERPINELIKEYLNTENVFENTNIEKKVFVFWWDGFDVAPEVVKRCIASVKQFYDGYQILEIDKFNYREYTDIDILIQEGFNKSRISIQTFSDILRFNLLKNNGGIWIDSTILFNKKVDLLEDLEQENKSFTSLYFSTSAEFLTYKDIECSWSGFLIASRKHGALVSLMDYIFKEYYHRYKRYPIYLFIDAVFMICKLNKVDDDVLSKTLFREGNMFALYRILQLPYDNQLEYYITKVPQKLTWWTTQNSFHQETFLSNIMNSNDEEV